MGRMRLRYELIGAAVLVAATYFAVLRVAEAKNEATVGSGVFPLVEGHRAEQLAFAEVRAKLERMGELALSNRLEELRQERRTWVAPFLERERWAVFVETTPLVRRIYIRQQALLDPRSHLYPAGPPPDIPEDHQAAFAWVSLAGALRHELAHYDGLMEEAAAYDRELAWYEGLKRSPFLASQPEAARRAWEWGIDSAILSARKARERAMSRE
jgi:hypothetical protein